MKKKVFFILSSIILLVVFSLIFIDHFNHSELSNNKIKNESKEKELIKNNSNKKEDDIDVNEDNKNNVENTDDHNYNNDNSYSKSNKPNMESNSTSKSNVINNNSNTESSKANVSPPSPPQNNNPVQEQEPPRELTAWEKLGISEYDYYNTPSDNEGELAFKGSTSLCQNEINRLVNKYYDSGIDGGNYYTINGKYTHAYLGCGIKMYMNGNTYTYSQIKSMGFN